MQKTMTIEEIQSISQQHYLPENADAWGDLRKGVLMNVTVPVAKKVNEGRQGWIEVEWLHYNIFGALTRQTFQTQVANACQHLTEQINALGKLEPFKIREEGKREIGMESYDFKHRDIDFRAFCTFAHYALPKEVLAENPELPDDFPCPALHFKICTLVQHDQESEEVQDA